jgi:hypothetical protein
MKSNWAVDGQFADENYQDLIFINSPIEKFLSSHTQFIVVASKGMGKTLLMRLKRDKVQAERPGIVVIPHDSPSDYVNLTGTYEKGILSLMGTQSFWEDVWKVAIQTSILLNFPHKMTLEQQGVTVRELSRLDLPGDLLQSLMAAFKGEFHVHRTPSSVLSILLGASTSKLERLRRGAPQILDDLSIRYVNSACFVFIDSFDQAIENFLPGDLEAWAAAQVGLLRAAWHISRHNRHIKVYVTIRQEAYASFGGTERNNSKGSVLLLKYSKDDLRSLFRKAINHYEGMATEEEFVGLSSIYNEYVRQTEGVFDYIHRHLINVPRWFTILGGRLSELPKKKEVSNKKDYEMRLESVRKVVNDVSAELARDYACSEMKLFFRDVDPVEMTRELFSRVNSTVLSFSSVDYLSKLLTEKYNWKHPFSLLYNLGLLGLVQPKPGSTTRYQVFKKPYEFDWGFNNILPEDKRTPYLLHPALHFLITTMNPNCRFSAVLLGDGVPWTSKNDQVIRKETIKLFVSYAHSDQALVKSIITTMESYLNEIGHRYYIWFDEESMEAGQQVHDQIMKGLEEADFLVLMASPNSMKSKFVKIEWKQKMFEHFYNKNKNPNSVLPVFLSGLSPNEAPDHLRSIFGFSYNGPDDAPKIERLVEQILHMHRHSK